MIQKMLATTMLAMALFGWAAAPVAADHGVAHNGETAELSKTEGLVQDEVITVTGIGYAPGATLTVVQCYIFPATGPADCELSNYGQHTGTVGDDGVAAVEYKVNIVEGRCDPDNPCFVVISDGIGPDANAYGTEVTFAAEAPAATEPEEEPTPEPEPTATPEPEPTEEPTPKPEPTEAPAEPAEETAAATSASDSDDDGGGSSTGLIIAAVVIAALLGGGWFAMRGRNAS